jgi:mRNA interferase HicA
LKRKDPIRQLVDEGCYLHRRGAKHDIYIDAKNGKKTPIPRHTELKNTLCELIRKQLGLSQ